uniref:PH domain-containing protein n=1 Tax=Lutzomyia longipalpis TaxID=7200 RepID=A0A1B0EUT8_LUTLO
MKKVFFSVHAQSTCAATRRQKELELQVLTGPVRGWQGQELSTMGDIIHMGSVAVGPDHRDRYFVLFPQTLLILSVSQRMSAFIYEGKLPLTNIVVKRLEDSGTIKNAFELSAPLIERIVAVCQGPSEANKWVDLLSPFSNSLRRPGVDLKRTIGSNSSVNAPHPPPHGKLPLTNIVVKRLEDSGTIKNAFELSAPLIERIVAVCQGPSEANKWVDLLSPFSNSLRRPGVDLKRTIGSNSSVMLLILRLINSVISYNLARVDYQPTFPPKSYPPTAPYARLNEHFAQHVKKGKLTRYLVKALLYPEFRRDYDTSTIVMRRRHRTTIRMLRKKSTGSSEDKNSLSRQDAFECLSSSSSSSSSSESCSTGSTASNPFGLIRYFTGKRLTDTSRERTHYETFIDHGIEADCTKDIFDEVEKRPPYARLNEHFAQHVKKGKLTRYLVKALLYPEFRRDYDTSTIVMRRRHRTTIRMLRKKSTGSSEDKNNLSRQDAFECLSSSSSSSSESCSTGSTASNPFGLIRYFTGKRLTDTSRERTHYETFIDHGIEADCTKDIFDEVEKRRRPEERKCSVMSPPPSLGGSHQSRVTTPIHMSQHKRSHSFNHHLTFNQLQKQQQAQPQHPHPAPPLPPSHHPIQPKDITNQSLVVQNEKSVNPKANWSITNLRPAPPSRMSVQGGIVAPRKDPPTYEEDALVLRVIESYCAAYQSTSRNTMHSALQPWTPCLPIRGGKLKSSKHFSTSNPQLPFICGSPSNMMNNTNSTNSLNSSYIWREASPNNFNMYSTSVSSLNSSYRYSLGTAAAATTTAPSGMPGVTYEWRSVSEDKSPRHKTPPIKYKTASNYDNLANTPLLSRKVCPLPRQPSFKGGSGSPRSTPPQQQAYREHQLLYDRRINRSFDAPGQDSMKLPKGHPLRRSTPHLSGLEGDPALPGSNRDSMNATWCCIEKEDRTPTLRQIWGTVRQMQLDLKQIKEQISEERALRSHLQQLLMGHLEALGGQRDVC